MEPGRVVCALNIASAYPQHLSTRPKLGVRLNVFMEMGGVKKRHVGLANGTIYNGTWCSMGIQLATSFLTIFKLYTVLRT